MKNINYKIILLISGLVIFSGVSLAQTNNQSQLDGPASSTPPNDSLNYLLGDEIVEFLNDGTLPPNTNTTVTEYEGDTGLVGCSGVDCNFNTFFATITSMLKYIYITAFSIATVLFAYAGILLMSSQGDMGKVDKAKGIFKNVIIGLVIMALSYWAVWALLDKLGVGTEFYRFLSN